MAPLVADLVADGLVAAGVARVFTTGPGAGGGLADAIRSRGLACIASPSAAAVAVMAAVTGEVSGAPGVLILTPADALTADAGVRHAWRAGAPLLLFSDGAWATELAAPVKATCRITARTAGAELAHALDLALRDPRGPVHVALSAHVAAQPAADERCREPAPARAPDPSVLDRAAGMLGTADRPLLVIGRRCRSGTVARWLRALAEAVPMPVLATGQGRGVLPDPHPLMLGLLEDGEAVLARADLIVAAGIDTGEAAAWPPLPRLDLGALATDTVPPPGVVRVPGDVALIVEELAPRLRDRPRADWDVAELDRRKRAGRAGTSSPEVSLVRALTPPGTIATVDTGPNASVVAAGWPVVGPNELLIGTGSPSQPFAPAAAVAAALARPGVRAVAFVDAAGLDAADAAMEIAGRLSAPVMLIALGGDVALSGDALAGAVHRALAGGGLQILAARV